MNIRHFKRRDLLLRFVKAVLSLPRETPISRYTVNQNPSYMNRETVVRHERAWATRTGSKVKVRQFFFRIRVPTSRCLDGALTMFASNFISNICGAIYITTSCVHTFVRLSPLSLSSTFFFMYRSIFVETVSQTYKYSDAVAIGAKTLLSFCNLRCPRRMFRKVKVPFIWIDPSCKCFCKSSHSDAPLASAFVVSFSLLSRGFAYVRNGLTEICSRWRRRWGGGRRSSMFRA